MDRVLRYLQRWDDRTLKVTTKESVSTYTYQALGQDLGTCCWEREECLQLERRLLQQVQQGISGEVQSRIAVKGAVLKVLPHGFLCVYSPRRQDIEQLVRTSRFEDSRSFAFAYKSKRGLHGRELLVDLVEESPLESLEYAEENCKIVMKGLKRITAALERTEDCFIYILGEVKSKMKPVLHITLPGGKRSLAEIPLETALRELHEETAIRLDLDAEPDSVRLWDQGAELFFVHYSSKSSLGDMLEAKSD